MQEDNAYRREITIDVTRNVNSQRNVVIEVDPVSRLRHANNGILLDEIQLAVGRRIDPKRCTFTAQVKLQQIVRKQNVTICRVGGLCCCCLICRATTNAGAHTFITVRSTITIITCNRLKQQRRNKIIGTAETLETVGKKQTTVGMHVEHS